MSGYDIDALSERMRGWLLEADTDLKAFDKLINEDNEDLRLRSLFHLQQVAEKMGKAMAIFYGIISCETEKVMENMANVVGQRSEVVRVISEKMNELCNLSEIAVKQPDKFGKELGHDLEKIRNIEDELHTLLREPQNMEDLINFAKEYFQKIFPSKPRITHVEPILIIIQIAEQLVLSMLESLRKELRNPPEYNDYQCVKEVVNHIAELNNSLNKIHVGLKSVKDILTKLTNILNCKINNECMDRINKIIDAFIDALRIYIGGGFLMLHVVNCLSNLEQNSRYCRAEGKACPPTNDEYLRHYREVAEFLRDFEESLNRLNELNKVYVDLQKRLTSVDAVIETTLSDPCIKEILKCINIALLKTQTANQSSTSGAQP